MDLSRKKYVKTSTEFMYAWLAVLHLRRRSGDYSNARVRRRVRPASRAGCWPGDANDADLSIKRGPACMNAFWRCLWCIHVSSLTLQAANQGSQNMYTHGRCLIRFLKHASANICKIYILNINTVHSLFSVSSNFWKTWLVHQFYMVSESRSLKFDTCIAHAWLKRK
jgi:hypothetical protein